MPGNDPVGYHWLYLFRENFDLSFGKTFCTFLSFVFVGSELSVTIWFVLSVCKHFSMYLSLFIITTPLTLSAFKTAISLLSDSSLKTFLYLYGTFIFVYLSLVFLRFVLICRNSFYGTLEIPLSKIWKKTSNSV